MGDHQLLSTVDVEHLNDRLAREYSIDDYYTRSPRLVRFVEQRRLARIREFVGDASGLDVAEIGVGGGHVLRMFPRARLTAVDVSGVYLDIARRNLAGYDVRFVKGDVVQLSIPSASFDRVICTEVLEHVVDPDAVLAAISRLLRPAGIAVITIPNDPLIDQLKGYLRRRPFRWLVRGQIDWGGEEFHFHHWTLEEFGSVLTRHLRVIERRAEPLSLPIRACFKCVQK